MVATNSTFIQQAFYWDDKRTKAAVMLASGESKVTTARECEIDRVTLYHWLEHPDFAAEVDRLSLMIHISSRAERLRIAMRVAKARVGDDDSVPQTDKDLLDWLKFAQSETDGAKIDLSKLAEMLSGESSGSETQPASSLSAGAIEVEAGQRQLTASSEVAEVQGAQEVTEDNETFNPS